MYYAELDNTSIVMKNNDDNLPTNLIHYENKIQAHNFGGPWRSWAPFKAKVQKCRCSSAPFLSKRAFLLDGKGFILKIFWG